jgi:sigma-B regulation protein RsbU (phosphoserine phosphatase)
MNDITHHHEFARAHVLIVDDERTNRLILRSICEKLGIGILDEAESGQAALDIVTRFQPDMMLLDIRMPEMDGFEVIRRIRQNPTHQNMSILVATSMQDSADRLRCFNYGASDVVSRPFDPHELTARIRAHLRSTVAARVLFDYRNRIQAHVEITQGFLSSILPAPEQLSQLEQHYSISLSHHYQQHDEIGGDLWYIRQLDETRLALIIVDASAHGLAGAINALRVDCLLQEYFAEVCEPARFLSHLDQAMAKIAFGQLFAGAFVMTYDRHSGQIDYAGSGMPKPLLCHDGQVIELDCGGLPLGSGMIQSKSKTITLASNDTLLLFSDGWPDGLAAPPAHYLDKLDLAKPNLAAGLAARSTPHDDLTLITLRRL